MESTEDVRDVRWTREQPEISTPLVGASDNAVVLRQCLDGSSVNKDREVGATEGQGRGGYNNERSRSYGNTNRSTLRTPDAFACAG